MNTTRTLCRALSAALHVPGVERWAEQLGRRELLPGLDHEVYALDAALLLAATGARDRTGNVYSLPEAVASSVGVKLKPQDVEQNFARWGREFDRVERDLRFEARRLESDRERGIISQASFDRAWDRLLDKFENLATSKREVLAPQR